MNSFKIVLLSGLLGMTWVDCGRRPEQQTHAFPEAAYESAPTNAMVAPIQADRVSSAKSTPALTQCRP